MPEERLGDIHHVGLREGKWKGVEHTDRRQLGRGGSGARRTQRLFDGAGAHLDFQIVHGRTGHGHHERGGIAEIALEAHPGGAGGETRAERQEFEIDIAELLAAIAGVFGELHVDEGRAGQGNRADAVTIGGGRMDGFVFGDGLFDGAGDQLFHFLRGGAGPLAGGHGHAHGDLRIFALGHGEKSEQSPGDHGHQRGPRDLPVFHEKPRGVVLVLN